MCWYWSRAIRTSFEPVARNLKATFVRGARAGTSRRTDRRPRREHVGSRAPRTPHNSLGSLACVVPERAKYADAQGDYAAMMPGRH